MCAFQPQPRIETDRLILRPPGLQDAPRIADLINDFDVSRMLTRVPYPYSLQDAEGFIAHMQTSQERGFLIEHKEFGPIGMLGFNPTPPSEADVFVGPEMGYWLGRTFWGRGFATEAATAALAWAKNDWGVRAVTSGHYADNPASGQVLVKAGFLYTGQVQPRFALARQAIAPTLMMVWLA